MSLHVILRILVLPALLLFSCMEREKVPENLIPKEIMKEILTDMHYADAYAFQEFRADTIYRAAAGMYLDIFEKYNVDSADFNTSFHYYVLHPVLLDKMYQAMIDSVQARETRLKK
ncbi:MAG TPA: DUF4296 domain-containing protein [Anseongella sp.]